MRELKFRGITTANGVMVYGNLVFELSDRNTPTIIDSNGSAHFVLGDTVGQYIGLPDKQCKEIYEGDLMTWPHVEGVWADQLDKIIEVKYPFICGNAYLGEIIGNVHENPGLLKKG